MSPKDNYRNALDKIRVITDAECRDLAWRLVAENPGLFCKLTSVTIIPSLWAEIEAKYKTLPGLPTFRITKELIEGARAVEKSTPEDSSYTTGKIRAIKYIRNITGMGLKESKDFFEEDLPRL